MGVLRPLLAAALLAPAACYDPRLPDCAVACASSRDCAPGQACSAEGRCAAPDHACAPAGVDAPRPPRDAAPGDGAPVKVVLRVRVDPGGKVIGPGDGTCDGYAPVGGDCWYAVPAGVPLTLDAVPYPGHRFDRWASAACGPAGPSCVLTPTGALLEVRARFKKGGGGGIGNAGDAAPALAARAEPG